MSEHWKYFPKYTELKANSIRPDRHQKQGLIVRMMTRMRKLSILYL